ncbi:MAG: dihydroneopterin aldolase [Chitinophagaceae bacterium]|nr:dihydroneopterin aldolase [Chitinophagaceae bacterium]
MADLITVELTDLHFFAYHGLYPEERKTGNEFLVNLAVDYQPGADIVNDITGSINYATLFEIIKKQMQQPSDLLETLSMTIAAEVHSSFPQIKKIQISISKMHPPIASFEGKVTVTYLKEY